jgi:hypothetical protein
VRARAIEKLGPMGAYPLLRAAGIDRHMRLHDLRHTGATAALNGHLDGERYSLTEVGTMLGHKDVRTTQIYAQTSEGDLFAEVTRRRARAEEVGSQNGSPDQPASDAAPKAQSMPRFGGRATEDSNL